MNQLLAISGRTGLHLAEIAFLLIVIAGVGVVASLIPRFRLRTVGPIVAGVLLASAGLLLIIAAHWGQYGQ